MTREESAVVELGTTQYSPGVCRALILAFVLTIGAVPLFDAVSDMFHIVVVRRALRARGGDVSQLPRSRPYSFDILGLLPPWRALVSARSAGQLTALLPTPARLRAYEDSLVIHSAAGSLIRPWIQWTLTGGLGTGSERVVVGRDGWLFYSDGIEYVTGPGFLDAEQLARRSSGGGQPDPRKAILQFRDVLKEAGASLVVFPVPDKVLIRPASFNPSARTASVATQNPSWDAFSEDLRDAGIPMLDMTEEMYAQENGGNEQFLRTDSHWSPSAIDGAARALARLLVDQVGLPPGRSAAYTRRQLDFRRYGDLVTLLGLPASRADRLSPLERVSASQVVSDSGGLWQADPSSDILLIGDSFLEIYSVVERKREPVSAAGLAEQLSYYLQRPTDRIARHQWTGLGDAREALGRTLLEVREKARGRKIVIWEFSMRSLATLEWSLMNEAPR